MQLSDQDLINEIRLGNGQVFETIFRLYYAPLCQYAHTFLMDYDEAEEMAQAVFIAVWEKRDTLEITVSLKSYLYRSVHNRCLNRIRHLAVQAGYREQAAYEMYQSGGNTAVETPSQGVIAGELSERLQHAIQRLPEQCRIIFMMSRFEELKYQEIADQLGLSIKTVENQIGKALRVLRTELADYLPILLVLMLMES